jgi:hypothetical protein
LTFFTARQAAKPPRNLFLSGLCAVAAWRENSQEIIYNYLPLVKKEEHI